MVVRMRHTRSHTANRRSHHALKKVGVNKDAKTGSVSLRHRVDMSTGLYRGRKIFDLAKKTANKLAKNKSKKA